MKTKTVYGIYVYFPTEGTYITMAQCHECDDLIPTGMIEQVTGNLIDWHDIEYLDHVNIALDWVKNNITGYNRIEVCELYYDENDYLGEKQLKNEIY